MYIMIIIIHPPGIKINPLKMACGCPLGGVIKNGHAHAMPLPYIQNAFVNVQLRSDPHSVQLGNKIINC